MVVLLQLVGASLMATVVMIEHVDVWAFSFISLTLSGTMLGLVLLTDFGDLLLSDADRQIVGPCPVPWQTYLLARALNLGLYAGILAAGMHVFPCVAGLWLKGASLWFVPAYALAAGVLTVWVVAAALGVSVLALRGQRKRVREVLAVAQVAPLLLVFYGGQLLWNDTHHHLQMFAANPPPWLSGLPTAWLASGVREAVRPGFPAIAIGLGSIASAVAAGMVALRLLATASPWEASPAAGSPPGGSPSARRVTAQASFARSVDAQPRSRPHGRVDTSDRYHRAGFTFARTLLTRDPDLAARVIPYLGMSVGALVLSFAQGRLADPYVTAGLKSSSSTAGANGPGLAGAGLESAGAFLALYLLVLAAPTIVQSLAFSRDAAAAWALGVAPIARPARFVEGACAAVERRLLYPAFAVLAAVLALLWRAPLHALVHVSLGTVAAAAVGALARGFMVRELPFSRVPERLETLTTHLAGQAVTMALCTLFSLAHARACASVEATAAYALLLGIGYVGLNTWSRARLAKSLGSTLAF